MGNHKAITPDQVADIRRRVIEDPSGTNKVALRAEFSISKSTLSNIISGRYELREKHKKLSEEEKLIIVENPDGLTHDQLAEKVWRFPVPHKQYSCGKDKSCTENSFK